MLTETNQDGNIYIVVDNATKEKVQKNVEKSCWQRIQRMIRYQSCVKRQQRKEPWQINSSTTLKFLIKRENSERVKTQPKKQ